MNDAASSPTRPDRPGTAPGDAPVVLITGAGRGIGAQTALLAARRGWDVVINFARDEASAGDVARQVRDLGRRAWTLRADVADEQAVHAMFTQIDDHGIVLSAVVNNAGIVAPRARIADMDTARWRRLLDVNVFGTWLCAREAVRRMSRRHGGAGGVIVNVSSIAATLGAPDMYVDYASTKAAIDGFTLGLGREVAAEGVRVVGVRPGIIDTDIHADSGDRDRPAKSADLIPMRRPGRADEVAAAIVWLMSAEASYVTAATLDVTGAR